MSQGEYVAAAYGVVFVALLVYVAIIAAKLARLERDGLVVGEDVPEDSRQKRIYALTDAGRAALD